MKLTFKNFLSIFLAVFGIAGILLLGVLLGMHLEKTNQRPLPLKKEKVNKPTAKPKETKTVDTVYVEVNQKPDTLILKDTILIKEATDTLNLAFSDSSSAEDYENLPYENTSEEEFEIDTIHDETMYKREFSSPEKDKIKEKVLIHTLTIKPKTAIPDSVSNNNAAKNAGIRNSKSQEFVLEFWKSPLNTKGYQLGNNKILLYGLEWKNQEILLYNLKDSLLLQIDKSYYILKNTYETRSFNSITENKAQLITNTF